MLLHTRRLTFCLFLSSFGFASGIYNPGSGGGGGGGGSSALQVTQSGVQISSPTSSINFLGPPFIATQVNTSTAQITLDASSVTLQGNNLSATYLTNSSATATYLNLNQGLTQSSATATYLQVSSATSTYLQSSSAPLTYANLNQALTQSSATATYLQLTSATATYLQRSSATITYLNVNQGLTQSSATATYLQLSSATATYINKNQATVASLNPGFLQVGHGSAFFGVNASSYMPVGNSFMQFTSTAEAFVQIPFHSSGTLRGFWIQVKTNSLTSAATFYVRINGNPGNEQIIVPAGAIGEFQDTGNIDVINVNDKVNYLVSTSVGGTSLNLLGISVLFQAPTNNVMKMVASGNPTNTITSGAPTFYTPLSGELDTADQLESSTSYKIKTGGTFSNLGIYVSANTRPDTTTIHFRKNGADGNEVLSIPPSGTGLFEDNTNTDLVVVGDTVAYSIVMGGNGSSNPFTLNWIGSEFATTGNSTEYISQTVQHSFAAGDSAFYPIQGFCGTDNAEISDMQVKSQVGMLCSNLHVYLSSNSINQPITIVFRKNQANGLQTLTIPSGGWGYYEDTISSHTDFISPGDELDWKETVPAGSGTAPFNYIGMTCRYSGTQPPGGIDQQILFADKETTSGSSGLTFNKTTGLTSHTYGVVAGTFTSTASGNIFTNGAATSDIDTIGVMDVFKQGASIGDIILSAGSNQQVDQFQVKDRSPLGLTAYGVNAGGLQVGNSGALQKISSNQTANNFIEYYNSGTMNLSTDVGANNDIVMKPGATENVRVSNTSGMTVTSSEVVKGAGGLNVTYGVVGGSLTASNLSTGLCVQTGTGGLLTTAAAACGTGGGGGGTSTLGISSGSALTSVVISSPTSNVVFSSNVFVGSLQGTTTSFIDLNRSSVTLKGNTNVALLNSTQTWTSFQTFNSSITISTLTVTQSAVIPSFSQNFGRATLNQWFSSMASLQALTTPLRNNKLSIFMLGDSHFAKNVETGPFIDWMYSNFGNAGTYFPLSDNSEFDDTTRHGCNYVKTGNWVTNPLVSTSLGLDDDSMHTSTPTSTIIGTCPQSDMVILHYTKQPNGGTISFSVDGGAAMTLPTANATTAVASATISGLTYGVHTASVTFINPAGTAGIDVLDYVFYSSSTPGAVVYRVGTNAIRADHYTAQDATKYQNLLAMLPSTPSVVMVGLDVNDASTNIPPDTFVASVESIVQRFRNVYPNIDCVYVSEPDFLNSASDTYPMSAYASAFLQASVKDQCAFVDFTAYFSSQPIFSRYYSDTIHLNTQGGQVGAQLLINTFSNDVTNITPFTVNIASGVVAYGNDQSTNAISNVTLFGQNILVSTGVNNSGAMGANLTITSSNTFLIGGAIGSGVEQNLKVGTITVSVANVTGAAGANVTYDVMASSLVLANSTSATTLFVSTSVTGVSQLSVSSTIAVNPSDAILSISSTSGTTILWINNAGNLISSGTTTTVSSCGTSPSVAGNNIAGQITVGGGVVTSCTLTFANGGFLAPPICVATDNSTTVSVSNGAISNTAAVFNTSATLGGGLINYICMGYQK